MACGKPILGWNWGGTAEIVQHGVHGYLATVGDYDSLVEGFHYIRENYITMSQACRKLVEDRYQWKTIIKRYADLYASVIASGRELVNV